MSTNRSRQGKEPRMGADTRMMWSDYRKSRPGQFIRIRLKIEQNYRLYLDIFFSAIINDLFITFISRIKVDAKCVYQQWNWITVANYFGTPPADWVHGYLYFEPGAWIWTKGFRRYLHIVKNWSGNFSLNSSRVRALGWPLLGIFSGFFWFFLGGSVGQIIYREYIVFRGSNISCSLACTPADRIFSVCIFWPGMRLDCSILSF